MRGTSAACSLLGRPVVSTSTVTGFRTGRVDCSAVAVPVATRQRNRFANPDRDNQRMFSIPDMAMAMAMILLTGREAKGDGLIKVVSPSRRPTDRLQSVLDHILSDLSPKCRAHTR